MKITFFLSLMILASCNDKKINNISKVNSDEKQQIQLKSKKNNTKENNIGFLVLKNIYDQNNLLTIYNSDKSKWKSFKFNDNFEDKDIAPEAVKPENTLLVFKCLGKKNSFYKIVVNEEKNIIKYVDEFDINFTYQSLEQHILSVFSVDFNESDNPLKLQPQEKAKQILKNKDSFYYPIKIDKNWLMVEDDDKNRFWIRWCDENGNLILDLYYEA